MQRVRWGVLGTASIARRHAIPAISASQSGVVQAVASREYQKAAQVAEEFGIPLALEGYEELVTSDEVDAVYIPLPNDMHRHWVIRAIRAGKHVLCEKPLALNTEEIEEIIEAEAGSGLVVMEGVTSYFHPVHEHVVRLVREGAVGEPRFIRMSLGWSFQGKREDFRWQKERGGGGLLDIGCYCIFHSRLIAGREPQWTLATATYDPETGVDTNMAILLQFPGGLASVIDCGILTAWRNQYEVIGTSGKIIVETPFGNGVRSRKATLYDATGKVLSEEVLTANQFELMVESVSRAILTGQEAPISLQESLTNSRILDACGRSAQSGGQRVEL